MHLRVATLHRAIDLKTKNRGITSEKWAQKVDFPTKTPPKVDFGYKYRKIDPIHQNIAVLGAKNGPKMSIFIQKTGF